MPTEAPPTSNHVTDAVKELGDAYIVLTSNGTPQMSKVVLSSGQSLGLVQSLTWTLSLGDYARCHIETIAAPAELKVMLRDTTFSVQPKAGYNPFQYLWDWTCAWVYNLFTRPS